MNWPAIAVAVVANFILGGLWYSHVLFGNRFLAAMGWSQEELKKVQEQGEARELGLVVLASIATAVVLARLLVETRRASAAAGAALGALVWLAFHLATVLDTVLF